MLQAELLKLVLGFIFLPHLEASFLAKVGPSENEEGKKDTCSPGTRDPSSLPPMPAPSTPLSRGSWLLPEGDETLQAQTAAPGTALASVPWATCE